MSVLSSMVCASSGLCLGRRGDPSAHCGLCSPAGSEEQAVVEGVEVAPQVHRHRGDRHPALAEQVQPTGRIDVQTEVTSVIALVLVGQNVDVALDLHGH